MTTAPTTTRRPTAELDDTPGTRLPCEWLSESTVGQSMARKRLRLEMSWGLYKALHTGHLSAIGGDPAKVRAWCWDQADKFLAESDRVVVVAVPAVANTTTTTPAPAARRGDDITSTTESQNKYLEWLAAPHRGGKCGLYETPPSFTPVMAMAVTRNLLRHGLIDLTYSTVGGSKRASGYTLTAAGRAKVNAGDTIDPDTSNADDDTVDYVPPPSGIETEMPAERVA